MTWTGCEETAWWLTWALRQGEVCERVNAAALAQASAPELIEAIIVDLEPATQERVRMDMGELPAASIHGILAAWRMAADGGMPFVFESVRPERPLDLARRRSVRLTVDVDDEGVRAGLSHIPSRHPGWARGVR